MQNPILKNTKVSIIIPALNEEKNLPILFESIKKQELTSDVNISEIILVDNGSIDNTLEISKKYCSNILVRPDDSIAELRNYGAINSSGEILIFLDADCILGKNAIIEVASLLRDEKITAVGPDGLTPYGNCTWVQEIWHFHTKVMRYGENILEVENLSSGFLGVRAIDFFKVGGFDGALTIGEDSDLSRRLRKNGFKLIKSQNLRIYNSGHPRTLRDFIKREFWHGDSLCHLLRHKNIDLLTLYFGLNAVSILLIFLLILYNEHLIFVFLILFMMCVVPFLKSFIKVRKINTNTFKLLLIYILYINSRTAAFFKFK